MKKVYFGVNGDAVNNEVGDMLKIAVLSCIKHTQLEPIILYDGEDNDLSNFLNSNATLLRHTVSFKNHIVKLNEKYGYPLKALGAFQRTNICKIEMDQEFSLYCDCDILFQSNYDFSLLNPEFIAAGPRLNISDWNYFNSGVLIVNNERLRSEYLEFENYIVNNMLNNYPGLDEPHFNQFYKGRISRLPIELNWRPAWGYVNNVPIVHFHACKAHGFIETLEGKMTNWRFPHAETIRTFCLSNMYALKMYYEELSKYSAPCKLLNPVISKILDILDKSPVDELKDRLDALYSRQGSTTLFYAQNNYLINGLSSINYFDYQVQVGPTLTEQLQIHFSGIKSPAYFGGAFNECGEFIKGIDFKSDGHVEIKDTSFGCKLIIPRMEEANFTICVRLHTAVNNKKIALKLYSIDCKTIELSYAIGIDKWSEKTLLPKPIVINFDKQNVSKIRIDSCYNIDHCYFAYPKGIIRVECKNKLQYTKGINSIEFASGQEFDKEKLEFIIFTPLEHVSCSTLTIFYGEHVDNFRQNKKITINL